MTLKRCNYSLCKWCGKTYTNRFMYSHVQTCSCAESNHLPDISLDFNNITFPTHPYCGYQEFVKSIEDENFVPSSTYPSPEGEYPIKRNFRSFASYYKIGKEVLEDEISPDFVGQHTNLT